MPKSSTTLKKGDNLPPRGKAKKNLILDAISERALLGLDKGASRDEAEKAVFGFLAESAFNPTEDTSAVSNTCLNQLMKKGWPDVKPVYQPVEFELNENSKPHEKASQILKAASDGILPPDIANMLISSIASMLKIEEVTEIKREIEKIKEMLGINNE